MSVLKFENELIDVLKLLDPVEIVGLQVIVDKVVKPESVFDLENAGYRFINPGAYAKKIEVEITDDSGNAVVADLDIYVEILLTKQTDLTNEVV